MKKLPFDLIYDVISEDGDFEFEDDKYYYIDTINENHDDHGRSYTQIYERNVYDDNSRGYFAVDIYSVRYGHKDYALEEDYNDCELYEVEQRKVVTVLYERK